MGPFTTFSSNRERLSDAEIAQRCFEHTVQLGRLRDLVSDEHFPWMARCWTRGPRTMASGQNYLTTATVVISTGQKRNNDTHASTTDPDWALIRKGKGNAAKLSYLANALMENRNGLLVGIDVRYATGTGERGGALVLVDAYFRPGTRTDGAASHRRTPRAAPVTP